MMMVGQKDLACFKGGEKTTRSLRERFFPTGKMMSEAESKHFTEDLIV